MLKIKKLKDMTDDKEIRNRIELYCFAGYIVYLFAFLGLIYLFK